MTKQQQQIVVDISPAGNVTLDAQGFRGDQCEKATQHIEIVLGGGMQRKRKDDYYKPPLATGQDHKLTF